MPAVRRSAGARATDRPGSALIDVMKRLLYVIGIPGSGKSTLVGELVRGRPRRVYHNPVTHTAYADGLIQLGREREGRSGTDTLSMSIQPRVVAWLESPWAPERLIAEGDRLANGGFFNSVKTAGYELVVVLLDTPLAVAAERRAARGSNQNEAWVNGRVTKIQRLSERATLWVDGTKPLAEQVNVLHTNQLTGRIINDRGAHQGPQ